jgi:hypothetical protein
MASKQQEAKERQGYETNPIMPVCRNCQHYIFRIERVENVWDRSWTQEKRRCGLGGFNVKKTASCAKWELKA